MSQEKVGALFAELRIEDLTPADMRRAERNLDASVRRMDRLPDPRVSVDTDQIAPALERAERQMDGFYRDSAGRLRNSRGQFVRAGEDALDGFGEGLGDGDDVASAMGGWKAAMVAAGALLGVEAAKAMVAGFVGWAERDKETDRLGAALGLSESESDRLGRLAGELYAQAWGESVNDVTRTMQMGMAGGLFDLSDTDAEIEAVTTRMLDMAGVWEQDVGRIAAAAGSMLGTGVARDVWEALDILAAGFQDGANKADDLLDTFGEYSTAFEAMGTDGQTAIGLILQSLGAGARDSDFVVDALKEFGIKGKEGSDEVRDAFAMLGLDAGQLGADVAAGGDRARDALTTVLDALRRTEDPMARNAAAVALFGTKAEDLQDALYALDPSTALDGLDDIGGRMERVSEQVNDNVATSMEEMQRRVRLGFEDWLGSLWTAYESEGWDGVAEALGDDIEALGALWDEHGPAILDGLSEWLNTYGVDIAKDLALILGEAIFVGIKDGFLTVAHPGFLGEFITELGIEAAAKLDHMKGEVADALGGMWDGLTEEFRDSLNGAIDLWNSLELTLPSANIPGLGEVGGWTIDPPHVPHFDVGGTIPGAKGAAMLAVVHGGEVVYNGPQQEAMGRQLAALEQGQRQMAAAIGSGGGSGRTVVYTARPERIARDLMWERAG